MTYDKPKHEESMRLYNLCKINHVFGYVNHMRRQQAHLYLGSRLYFGRKLGANEETSPEWKGEGEPPSFCSTFFHACLGEKNQCYTP